MERELDKIFELASAWDAVLLFDEADIFLEYRTIEVANIARNAVVAGMLVPRKISLI
jgi:hypothetical protein